MRLSVSAKKRAARRNVASRVARKNSAPKRSKAFLAGVALAATLLSGFSSRARAAGHPQPTPNPAGRGSAPSSVSLYRQQGVTNSNVGFTSWRAVQRTTSFGPVLFVEQSIPLSGASQNIKVGAAQKIRISSNNVANIGFRSPEIGKGRVDWGAADFGLVLMGKNASLDVHRLGSVAKQRYTASVNVGKFVVDASYMEPGFFSRGPSARVGVARVEKALGLNLGKLSTEMGITFSRGQDGRSQDPQVDVTIYYPIPHGKLSLGTFSGGAGERRVSGQLVISF